MHVSILSFIEVGDLYPISCMPWQSLILHLPSHDLVFFHSGKHYVGKLQLILVGATHCMRVSNQNVLLKQKG
jgi:hypothetical protein